ncbi:hypothetical protein PMIN01_04038 [Paraphaeosphaeria minitans]|uniref:Uncharacterized protein n=1 Tax=Paraphaeosphaeria minitans TaxID=565426 RepID=A0A9P6GQN3_9PLEO|nr:hypothetical protein PMIN01_04038 [Paraphaeosphaeria minitans]
MQDVKPVESGQEEGSECLLKIDGGGGGGTAGAPRRRKAARPKSGRLSSVLLLGRRASCGGLRAVEATHGVTATPSGEGDSQRASAAPLLSRAALRCPVASQPHVAGDHPVRCWAHVVSLLWLGAGREAGRHAGTQARSQSAGRHRAGRHHRPARSHSAGRHHAPFSRAGTTHHSPFQQARRFCGNARHSVLAAGVASAPGKARRDRGAQKPSAEASRSAALQSPVARRPSPAVVAVAVAIVSASVATQTKTVSDALTAFPRDTGDATWRVRRCAVPLAAAPCPRRHRPPKAPNLPSPMNCAPPAAAPRRPQTSRPPAPSIPSSIHSTMALHLPLHHPFSRPSTRPWRSTCLCTINSLVHSTRPIALHLPLQCAPLSMRPLALCMRPALTTTASLPYPWQQPRSMLGARYFHRTPPTTLSQAPAPRGSTLRNVDRWDLREPVTIRPWTASLGECRHARARARARSLFGCVTRALLRIGRCPSSPLETHCG